MGDDNRLKMIDYIKGIAVILVVFGHCTEIDILNRIINSFHMPLFFLVSGYLIAYKDPTRYAFLPFLKKKFLRIMVPYFFFEFVNLIISFILLKSGICKDYVVDLPYAFLDILLCMNNYERYAGLIGRLLFFPCIFISYIVVYWVIRLYNLFKNKIGDKKYAVNIYFLIMAALFYILSFIERKLANGVLLWFCLDRALMGSAFMFLGAACKPLLDKFFKLHIAVHAIVFIVGAAVNLASVYFNYIHLVLMYMNYYGHSLWFGIGAVSGSLATVSFVALTEKILPEKPMKFFADNSGNMFGVQFIAMFICGFVVSAVFSLFPSFKYYNEITSTVKFVLTLLLCVPLCMLVNKIPLVGNKKSRL